MSGRLTLPIGGLRLSARKLATASAITVLAACSAMPQAALADPAPPFSQCPAVGADTSCALLIHVRADGQTGVYGDPSQGPFDGIEDTLIGVQNDSSAAVSNLPLTATTGKALFGFDGDGLCAFGVTGCPFGPTGYEGPGVSFSGISSDGTSGTVSFSPAIPPGGHAYFSLEEALSTVPPFDLEPGPPHRALRYVALGDSYSAGEGAGAGNYFQWQETRYRCTSAANGWPVFSVTRDFSAPVPGWHCTSYTVGHDVGCHRAPTAWSFTLAASAADIEDDVENAACSGATISKNLLDKWKENEQPQVERLRTLNAAKRVDLVTFTIGGNDVGFSDMARACFIGNGPAYTCRGAERGVADKLAKLDLVEPIRRLHAAAPNAVIAYVSYPQVVPDNDAAVTRCRWLDGVERRSVRSVVGELNLAEYNAVQQARREGIDATFVDISDALRGHELCTTDSHVVKIYGNKFNSEQAHPDSVDRSASGGTSGQQDLAKAVYGRLLALGVING